MQETIDKVKFSARFALVYFFGGDYDIDTRVAASYAANRDDAIVYWNIDGKIFLYVFFLFILFFRGKKVWNGHGDEFQDDYVSLQKRALYRHDAS